MNEVNEPLIAAILAGADTQPVEGAAGVYTVPQTARLEDLAETLEARQPRPNRARGTVVLDDLDSFIAWTNRHASRDDGGSAIYASAFEIVAVINDHASKAPAEPLPSMIYDANSELEPIDVTTIEPEHKPGWGDFRGVYSLPYSEEWLAWTGIDSEGLSQAAFAEFLETRILDAIAPEIAGSRSERMASAIGASLASPSDLLNLSRGLAIRISSKVTNVQNLSSGETQLSYGEEHTDAKGAPLKIPGAFAIAIPVFKRGPLWKIPVRLMYRWKGGDRVSWIMRLVDSDAVVEEARAEAIDRIRLECGLPTFRGKRPR